jgi:peptide/nickel transport system permease protein
MERFKFILTRPLQLVPVLFGVSIFSFFLVRSIPGDPVRILLGSRATPEVAAKIRAQYGLDEPLPTQYLLFLKNLLRGDFGKSIVYKTSVLDVVAERIWPTVNLLAYALVLAVAVAFVFAAVAARHNGRLPDVLVRIYSTAGLGLPTFWLGIILIMLFSVTLGWFPTSGYGDSAADRLYYLFLPAVSIALALSPVLIRNLRASLIAEMDSDYAIAARSRGMSENGIFFRHVFPNALVPTITLLGVNFSWLIGGTVVVEQVFSVPGLGQLMVASIFARDYLVVQLITLILAVAVIATNFVVDVLTVAIDPRVSL